MLIKADLFSPSVQEREKPGDYLDSIHLSVHVWTTLKRERKQSWPRWTVTVNNTPRLTLSQVKKTSVSVPTES